MQTRTGKKYETRKSLVFLFYEKIFSFLFSFILYIKKKDGVIVSNKKRNNTVKPKTANTSKSRSVPQMQELPKKDTEKNLSIKFTRILMLASVSSGIAFLICLILNITKLVAIHWLIILVLITLAIFLFIMSLLIVGNHLVSSGQLNINDIKAEETKKTIDKLNSNPVFAKYSKPTVQKSFKPNNKK